tara:strand:+ start:904 stop:1410 length:507 start_codon:yes stop_codon:yes gene_type:complete
MSKLLEEYNNTLNLKYYKTLKKILNKQHNTKYNSYFENILSEDLLSESECNNHSATFSPNLNTTLNPIYSATNSATLSDIKIKEDNIDDFYYKKPWNKLNIVHKKIKIKEYINNLMLTKQKKKILIDKLINLLNNKKLNKKNEVDYDSCNGKIITISILKCINDDYYI